MSEICNLWFGPLDGQHINRFLRSVTAHVTAERFIYRVGFRPLDSAFQIARITERITANESLSFLQPLLSSWTKSSHYWNFSTIIITQICFSVWRWKKNRKKEKRIKRTVIKKRSQFGCQSLYKWMRDFFVALFGYARVDSRLTHHTNREFVAYSENANSPSKFGEMTRSRAVVRETRTGKLR